MGFARYKIFLEQFARLSRAGDCFDMPLVTVNTADANTPIPLAAMAGGVWARSGLTVGRTDTTDTAANIIASPAFREMDIGDTYRFTVSNRSAQTLTIAGGTGVTMVGTATVAATSFRDFILVRTGAAAFDCIGL